MANLHGAGELAARPGARVLVLSSLASFAEALVRLPAFIAICPQGGDASPDWQPLSGRDVLLWPDYEHAIEFPYAARRVAFPAPGSNLPQLIEQGHTTPQAIAERVRHAIQPYEPTTRPVAAVTPTPSPDIAASSDTPRVMPRQTGDAFYELWERAGCSVNNSGLAHSNSANAAAILAASPQWSRHIWWDTFRSCLLTDIDGESRPWREIDTTNLLIWMQSVARLDRLHAGAVRDAIDAVARANQRDELADHLRSLVWDDVPRLRHFLPTVFGTPADDYHAAVGRNFLVSLVARALTPGCKVDTMPVFEGPEGLYKSTALSILGGKFFAEASVGTRLDTRDFLMTLHGVWVMEIPELHTLSAAKVEAVKGMLSTATDAYVPKWAREVQYFPRRVVFAGTTNRDDWNASDTGARRFWPVKVNGIDTDKLRALRNVLLAEAVWEHSQGAKWWEVPRGTHAEMVAARRPEDPWEYHIGRFIEGRNEVSAQEIMEALEIPRERQERKAQMRVASILRDAGFARIVTKREGQSLRVWRRGREVVDSDLL